jgi:hypothetical protein
MIAALLLGLTLDAQTPAAPPQEPPLKVVVASPVYQPDGTTSVETVTLPDTPGVVHLYSRRAICDTATAGATEPADAAFGWRLTSQTITASASAVTLSLHWQRVWDGGRKVQNGPSGTVQLTLRPGTRIPLDHIPNPSPSDACRAVGLGLEVKLARTTASPPSNTTLAPVGSVAGGTAALDADLWLVHTTPAGTSQAHHQKVRLARDGVTAFGFAPVTVTTTRGDVSVELIGTFRRYIAPGQQEYLSVAMSRRFAGDALPAGVIDGTETIFPVPSASEVLSLQIPAGSRAGGGGGGGRGGAAAGTGGARSRGAGGVGGTIGAVGAGGGGGGGQGTAAVMGRQTPAQPAGGGRGAVGPASPTAVLLAGHTFSLQLRVTPVN